MTETMTRTAAPTPARLPGLPSVLAVMGIVCLAIITLASPGATRMFAWPWTLAYAGTLLGPTLALIVRALDQSHPLNLPSRPWCATALAAATAILLSALASPYRGPSLLWSAPLLAALAFYFVVHDALQPPTNLASRLTPLVGGAFAAIVLTSLALWLPGIVGRSLDAIAFGRNPFPLGHANFTAGLALLGLPWLVALGCSTRGPQRLAWSIAVALTIVMFLGSGSRAGMIGLAALAFTAVILAPLARKKKAALAALLVLVGLAVVFAHPRTRAMLAPADPATESNRSNVQRSAMLTAATRMGADRPLLGWGPGTTPLVYPRYRAGLDGGAENVLQLHNTPAQLWAEFGGLGLACALASAALVLLHARRHAIAAVTLIGYGVFSVGDWQLDVPVFGFAVATCAALLSPPSWKTRIRSSRTVGLFTVLSFAAIVLLGRPDRTPELNLRALTLARDPAQASAAVALLGESLVLNPHQEIAHFNLGWLLLVSDPTAAEGHFRAALQLVPDKGGVYFGLGLARLNQNRSAGASRAFALECLHDPAFLFSPWWREPALAAHLPATRLAFAHLAAVAQKKLPPTTWAAGQLPAIAALAPRLGVIPEGPAHTYHRERRGYPVLIRDLNFAPPADLYDVRELVSSPTLSAPLPPKGWLPSPLLLELLDAPR